MNDFTRKLMLVVLAAFGGGVFAYALPLPLVELGVAITGLSEAIPAFQPPLGDTARLLLVGAVMIVCAFLAMVFMPRGQAADKRGDDKGYDMSFIRSGLTRLTRRKKAELTPAVEDVVAHDRLGKFVADHSLTTAVAPVLRKADSHPDAPPRAPLFVQRDLGGDLEDGLLPMSPADRQTGHATENFSVGSRENSENVGQAGYGIGAAGPDFSAEETGDAPFEEFPFIEPAEQNLSEWGASADGLAMPRAPEPLPWELIEREMSRIMNESRGGDGQRADGHDGMEAEQEDIPAAEEAARTAHHSITAFDPPAPDFSRPAAEQMDFGEPEPLRSEHEGPESEGPEHERTESVQPLQKPEAVAAPAALPENADSEPTIAQLVDRLERGLQRKRGGAGGPSGGGQSVQDNPGEQNIVSSGYPQAFSPPSPPGLSLVHGVLSDETDQSRQDEWTRSDDLQRALAALRATTARAR